MKAATPQTLTVGRMADQTKFDVSQVVGTLKALKSLRNNVGVVFQSLTDGIGLQYGQESRETKFVGELQHQLVAVQTSVRYQIAMLLFAISSFKLKMMIQGIRRCFIQCRISSRATAIRKHRTTEPGFNIGCTELI